MRTRHRRQPKQVGPNFTLYESRPVRASHCVRWHERPCSLRCAGWPPATLCSALRCTAACLAALVVASACAVKMSHNGAAGERARCPSCQVSERALVLLDLVREPWPTLSCLRCATEKSPRSCPRRLFSSPSPAPSRHTNPNSINSPLPPRLASLPLAYLCLPAPCAALHTD